MSLLQRIILAPNSTNADVKCDEQLVQKLFLKTIETGLQSTSVVAELRPLLSSKNSDEDFIFAVGQVSAADTERYNTKQQSKLPQIQAGSIHQVDLNNQEELQKHLFNIVHILLTQ